jgi:phosphoribosylformylglycinamidine synthase subunit PurQ / glutaminase
MRRVAVVRFPGSNCDVDALRAAEAVGAEACFVWHRDETLAGADAVILPGGFSYGDYLRSGAIARFSPIMAAVQRHAAEGGAVLGICNGFQILCEAHLLPGALMRNADLMFISRPVPVTVERTDTPFTSAYAPGTLLRLPVAHGDGRFVASEDVLRTLEADKRVVLRYAGGDPAAGLQNPNGSMHDIAGISNADGNVVGIMPHPERVIDPLLGNDDGIGFFRSLVRSVVMATIVLGLAAGAAKRAVAQTPGVLPAFPIAPHPGHRFAGMSSSADRSPAFTPSPDSGSPSSPSRTR